MTEDDHRRALAVAAREELKRCRVALEALAVTFDALLDPKAAAFTGDDKALHRPASVLAMTLTSYLQAGGRLEPDLARDLSQAIAASSARRSFQ